MKRLFTIAKESAVKEDGFLNGLAKGMVISAGLIVFFTFSTGYAI